MDEANEYTPAQAADPSTPGEALAAIAGSRPDLRPYIAANPAAYPGLLDWLANLGDPAVDGALRARAAARPVAPAESGAPAQPEQEAGGAASEQGPLQPEGGYQAPSGAFEAPTAYVPPAATSPDAGMDFPFADQNPSGAQAPYGAPAGPYGAPGAAYGGPAGPYGAPAGPYGAPGPYGSPGGEQPKKSKTWLWVLLGLLGLVIVGGVVIAIIIFNVATRAANDVDNIFNDGLPSSYGDDATLDALWDACEEGDLSACDELFNESPDSSGYERFGDTCGNRTEGGTWCRDLEGDAGASAVPAPLSGAEAVAYGDDASFDALWDACEMGDMASCDGLYRDSPLGSEYKGFGDTCGGRTDGGTWCSSD